MFLLLCLAPALGLLSVFLLRVYYGSNDSYVRTNILSVLSRLGMLPNWIANSEMGQALQWSHEAVQAPYMKRGGAARVRRKYKNRVCNFTTSKGIDLEGELWSPEGLENTPLPCVL